jgi:hypothetical protein
LDFFGRPVLLGPSQGHHSGDAGLLPVCQFDERIGPTRALPKPSMTPAGWTLTQHTFLEKIQSRVCGILAGYEGQNDHDTVRHGPAFTLPADRSAKDNDSASQRVLSRVERAARPWPLVPTGRRVFCATSRGGGLLGNPLADRNPFQWYCLRPVDERLRPKRAKSSGAAWPPARIILRATNRLRPPKGPVQRAVRMAARKPGAGRLRPAAWPVATTWGPRKPTLAERSRFEISVGD